MPCNLYGTGDKFDEENSHVIPALIKRFHSSKLANNSQIEIWGSGEPRREFLYVDDAARGVVFALRHYDGDMPLNMGAGHDVRISDLASMIMEISGYDGQIQFDNSKPDGVKSKLMDSSKIYHAGWKPEVDLKFGLEKTYQWFVGQYG